MPKMHFNDRKTFIILKYSHICIIYLRPVIGPPAVDNLDPIKSDQIQTDRGKHYNGHGPDQMVKYT